MVEVPRDRYGRPLIIPPHGGELQPYMRVTTFAGVLEDTHGLQKWFQRQTMLGLVERPDLILAVKAHRQDKTKLTQIAEDAMQVAASSAAANVGTALHKLTEDIDRGIDVGTIPGEYQQDLDAYQRTLEYNQVAPIALERFVVLDDLKVAGTFDRLVDHRGQFYIADIKTGSIEYGKVKIAIQLACYAHGAYYDPDGGIRSSIPDINQEKGIIIHLPAGQHTCTLYWVDLKAGWEAAQLADSVRAWRMRRSLFTQFDLDAAAAVTNLRPLIGDPILAEIHAASTVAALGACWRANHQQWTDEHTHAAARRKKQLTA
jgi:PD-(D/E)XK nuclease superfamily